MVISYKKRLTHY